MRNGIFFVKRMPPVLSLSNFYGAGPANVHIESTGPGLCAIHPSAWKENSAKFATPSNALATARTTKTSPFGGCVEYQLLIRLFL